MIKSILLSSILIIGIVGCGSNDTKSNSNSWSTYPIVYGDEINSSGSYTIPSVQR